MPEPDLIQQFVSLIRCHVSQMYITRNDRLIDFHYECIKRALSDIDTITEAL